MSDEWSGVERENDPSVLVRATHIGQSQPLCVSFPFPDCFSAVYDKAKIITFKRDECVTSLFVGTSYQQLTTILNFEFRRVVTKRFTRI